MIIHSAIGTYQLSKCVTRAKALNSRAAIRTF